MPPDPAPVKKAAAKKAVGSTLKAVPPVQERPPLQIEDMQDSNTGDWFRWLFYSDPGVGKTVLISQGGPDTLIADADLGTSSAKAAGSTAKRLSIRDWDDMNALYEHIAYEKHGLRWVWLDGVSLFQERGLGQIMEDLVAEKPHRKLWQADKGEIGQNMSRISTWVRTMCDLPINFGITAHTFRYEDKYGNLVYMPWVQGKMMPEKVCGWMNMVGHYYKEVKGDDVKRILLVETDGEHYAKNRYQFPARILNPTLASLEAAASRSLQSGGIKKAAPVKKQAAKA